MVSFSEQSQRKRSRDKQVESGKIFCETYLLWRRYLGEFDHLKGSLVDRSRGFVVFRRSLSEWKGRRFKVSQRGRKEKWGKVILAYRGET